MKSIYIKVFVSLLIIAIITLLVILLEERKEMKIFGAGISAEFYNKIIAYGNGSSTYFRNSKNEKVLTDQVEIDMLDFIEVVQVLKDDEGLVFWPAMENKESKNITYTMAAIRESDGGLVGDLFFLLNENLSSYGELDGKKVNKTKDFYNNYYNTYNSQLEYAAAGKMASRYYSKPELVEMLFERNVDAYDDNLVQYKWYNLNLEGTILRSEDVEYISSRLPSQKPSPWEWEYHIGFTVVLRVEKGGEFIGTAYEIGKPCPPRCSN